MDLTILTFLIRQDQRRLTNEEAAALVESTAGRRSTWWMPGKDWKSTVVSLPTIMARYNGAKHPEQPVSVRVPAGNGATELVAYASWAEYEAAHDAKSYPPKRVQSLDGVTVVLVTPKPWAGRKPAAVPAQGAVPKSNKATLIGEMLLKGGVTAKELCEAVGWPSISVPAQAKTVGLTLRKEKVDGMTKYWGTRE